jgi:hypothetical protein
MTLLPEDCPLHCTPLVPTPQKSLLAGKCVWRDCYYGILTSDPTRQVRDVTEWNFTDTGEPAEALDTENG